MAKLTKTTFLLIGLFFCFAKITSAQNLSANFTADETTICLGDPITFTSTSTGNNIVAYNWNFGNGETSTDENPVYTYPDPGVFTVTLTVQNGSGQADAEVKSTYITVNDLPHPHFSIDGDACSVPATLTFVNNSTPSTGIDYNWDFGNGATSNATQPPAVNYASAGTYTVILNAVDNNTSCTNSYSEDIPILNFSANFDGPATICKGGSAQFTDLSTAGTDGWSWQIDNTSVSTQQNPVLTFFNIGTHTITLIANNSNSGCADTIQKTITVHTATPPDFTSTTNSGCSPLTTSFQNLTGESGNYTWYFGDGTTSTDETPTHTYTGNGTYDVSLVFVDAEGCKDSITKEDFVEVSGVTALFNATHIKGCSPLTTQFTDLSITPNPISSPIVSWSWDFGNGNTSILQNPPPQTYTEGRYDVTLSIKTANGCVDTLTWNEFIKVGTPQQAGFTYAPTDTCSINSFYFTNTSVIDPSVDSSDIKWKWLFGDGGSSIFENPSHAYKQDTGYFDVTLILNYNGCRDTMKIDSAVHVRAPISRFQIEPNENKICNGDFPFTVHPGDQAILGSTTDTYEMHWKWGDGTETYLPNAALHSLGSGDTSHVYTGSNGNSIVIWQIVQNFNTGCFDSTSFTIPISTIQAGLTLDHDSVCKPGSVLANGTFSTSSDPIDSWKISFGNFLDSTFTTNSAILSYNFSSAGTYPITLSVKNSIGCIADTVIPFTVLELPQANFIATPTQGCSPLQVTVTNTSTSQGNGVGLASFTWTNQDTGNQTTTQNMNDVPPPYIFNGNGSHYISLKVKDSFGCVSPPRNIQIVITKPVADFTLDSVLCNNVQDTILNTSTGKNNLTYNWFVDNQPGGTMENFNYQFNDQSSNTYESHTIKLITTDGNGCKDTIEKPIIVSLPKANFSYLLNGAQVNSSKVFNCPPVFANFKDSSKSYGAITAWDWDFDDGNGSAQENPSNTYVFSGSYGTSLTITDEFGCKNTIHLDSIINIDGPSANPSIFHPADSCESLVVFSLGNHSNVSHVDWSFGDGNHISDSTIHTYSYQNPGSYITSVTISDSLGCEVVYDLDTIAIKPEHLQAYFTYSPTDIHFGDTIVFTDGSTFDTEPIVQWNWQLFGENYIHSTGENVIHYALEPGTHAVTLIIENAKGCTDKYTTTIEVGPPDIKIPNVFTPNGDGVNDLFTIDKDIFSHYKIIILNRWGNLVYEGDNQTGKVLWDGKTSKGKSCTDGVYFYKFIGQVIDGKTIIKRYGYVHVFY